MVPRSSPTRGGTDGCGFWRWFGADRLSDRERDRHGGVPACLHPLGPDPGSGRDRGRAVPRGSAPRLVATRLGARAAGPGSEEAPDIDGGPLRADGRDVPVLGAVSND